MSKKIYEKAFKHHNYNQTVAAKALGVSRATLRKKLGLDKGYEFKSFEQALKDAENEKYKKAYRICGENISKAAKMLGVSRNTLRSKL